MFRLFSLSRLQVHLGVGGKNSPNLLRFGLLCSGGPNFTPLTELQFVCEMEY